jgi:hypothetical protein
MKITLALLALTSLSMAQWGWWGPGIDADWLQGKDTAAMHSYAGRDSAKVQKGDTLVGRVKTAFIQPPADSVQALQIFKADGTTSIFNVDSRNGRVGIGTTTPSMPLDIAGDIRLSGSASRNIYGPTGANDLGLMSSQNMNFSGNSFTPLRLWRGNLALTTNGFNFNIGAADDAELGFFADRTGTTQWRARGSGAAANPTIIRSKGGRILFYADTNKTDLGTYTPTERMRIDCNGQVAIDSLPRSTEKLFVKGNIMSSGWVGVDSVLTAGSQRLGDTVIIRTGAAAPAFAASLRFTTYVDSSQAVDTINLAALNASGARARVLCLRESVFVTNGATVINTLPAAGKWADYEYLGSPCNRWQIFGSN